MTDSINDSVALVEQLRRDPQLLFDVLREVGQPKLASAWDEEEGSGTYSQWRRRAPHGDNVAHIVHAHPESAEGDTWHAIVLGASGGSLRRGFTTPGAARDYADTTLQEAGFELLGPMPAGTRFAWPRRPFLPVHIEVEIEPNVNGFQDYTWWIHQDHRHEAMAPATIIRRWWEERTPDGPRTPDPTTGATPDVGQSRSE